MKYIPSFNILEIEIKEEEEIIPPTKVIETKDLNRLLFKKKRSMHSFGRISQKRILPEGLIASSLK